MVHHNLLVRVMGEDYGEYRIELSASLFDQKISILPLDLDPLQITSLRSKLASNPSESLLRSLGALLFNALFPSDLAAFFHEPMTLRIQLAIEPNELSALPWELLFDPSTEQFLALNHHIVRLSSPQAPRSPQSSQSLRVTLPLRILALFPNLVDVPPIDIGHERAVMAEALKPLRNSGLVEWITLEHATVWEMVEALHERQVHILYYQGHVGFDPYRGSYFLLEDRSGEFIEKSMHALSYTLHDTDVRLAVINSCGMGAGTLAYDLVRHGIPGAIATQEPLLEQESTVFLQSFSEALVTGLTVDEAVSKGRRAMWRMSGLQGRWASPILVLGQSYNALFSLEERP